MAGMQVALGSLLKNFDPNTLEQRLQDSSILGNILPGAKKARYWEVFTELYKEIAQEAESDFYGLFGQAFARAYEEQINRLKSGR
jgi:predicted component of type VI protein secretion system